MKTKFYSRLHFRFGLLIFIASIPIIVITFLDAKYDEDREMAIAKAHLANLVDHAAMHEYQLFELTRQLLMAQKHLIDNKFFDKGKLNEHLEKLKELNEMYQNFGILDANGNLLMTSNKIDVNKNFSGFQFYKEAIKKKEFLLGPEDLTDNNNNKIIYAALPITNGSDKIEYIIFAKVKGTSYFQIGNELINSFPKHSIFIKTDDEGFVLNHFPSGNKDILKKLVHSKEYQKLFTDKSDDSGSFQIKLSNNICYEFIYSSPINNSYKKYYLIAGINRDQFLSEYYYSLNDDIILNGLVFVAIFILSWFLIKIYILNSIFSLIATTKKFTKGDFSKRSGLKYSISEIGELAESFDNLLDELNQEIDRRDEIEKSLRLSEKRFREVLENVKLIAIMLDKDGNIKFANNYLLNLTSWNLDEILDKNWYDIFLPQEIQNKAKATFIDLVSKGEYSAHKENYIITRTGEKRLISWNNTINRDFNGNIVGTTSIGEDVTERRRIENKLQITQDRFRAVIENIPMTIFATDKNGIFILHEGKGLKKLGMKPGENVGKSAYEIFGDFPFNVNNNEIMIGSEILNRLMKGETINVVSELNGVYFENYFAPSYGLNGHEITGMVGVALDITEQVKNQNEKEKIHVKLLESKNNLQKLTHKLIEVQETEKRNLAMELHDEIGQLLTAIKIDIQNLEERISEDNPEFNLTTNTSLIEEAIEKVRNVSLALRPSILDDMGLIPTLKWLTKRIHNNSGINATLNTNIGDISLDSIMEINLYRIIQEATTNIVRHTKSDRISISLNKVDGKIKLIVRDDGQGFDVEKAFNNAGEGASLGILSIKERVELLNGKLDIQSSSSGTTLTAIFSDLK